MILTDHIDLRTKEVLERAFEGIMTPGRYHSEVLLYIRVHLAYVLEHLGLDEVKQRE